MWTRRYHWGSLSLSLKKQSTTRSLHTIALPRPPSSRQPHPLLILTSVQVSAEAPLSKGACLTAPPRLNQASGLDTPLAPRTSHVAQSVRLSPLPTVSSMRTGTFASWCWLRAGSTPWRRETDVLERREEEEGGKKVICQPPAVKAVAQKEIHWVPCAPADLEPLACHGPTTSGLTTASLGPSRPSGDPQDGWASSPPIQLSG